MKFQTAPLVEFDRRSLRSERDDAHRLIGYLTLKKSTLSKAFNEKIGLLEQARAEAKKEGEGGAAKVGDKYLTPEQIEQKLGEFVARTEIIKARIAARIKLAKTRVEECTTAFREGFHETLIVLVLDPWAHRMRFVHPVTREVLVVRELTTKESEQAEDVQMYLPGTKPGCESLWDQTIEEPDSLSRDLMDGMPTPMAIARWNDLFGYQSRASVSPVPAPSPGIQAAVDRFKDAARDMGVGISVRAGGKTTVLVSTPEDKPAATKGKRAKKGAAA